MEGALIVAWLIVVGAPAQGLFGSGRLVFESLQFGELVPRRGTVHRNTASRADRV
jgi:hypothetical protein